MIKNGGELVKTLQDQPVSYPSRGGGGVIPDRFNLEEKHSSTADNRDVGRRSSRLFPLQIPYI